MKICPKCGSSMQDTAQQCPNCGYSFFAQPQNGMQGARQVRFATGASAPQGSFYTQPTPPTAMQTGNVPYGAAPSVKRARKVPLWVKIGAPILAAVVLVVGL
ncbi:MAG: zinc-ribbon domain-containing protein, partial [Candidatus Fimenecus sp.]